jgi:hypothetical protein
MKVVHVTEPGYQKAKPLQSKALTLAITILRRKLPGLKLVAWLMLIGLLLGTGLAATFRQSTPTLRQEDTALVPTATSVRLSVVQPTAEPMSTPEAPAAEETQAGARRRYADGDSQIVFRWDMLIDSFALAVSYAWLCCGVLVILGLPVMFVVLWVKGTNRRQMR